MTHSIDAPLPPPATAGTGSPTTSSMSTSSTSTSSTSTSDVAKDEARNVGQTAAQAGSQVASTAADQATHVVHETQRQAADLLDQGRSQLREQAMTQQQRAAEGLSSIASQLRGMADGTGGGAPGPARDLIQEASGKLEELGSWLQNREPAQLLDEVRSYARRKPGTFLLGAAIAGVVAGRLTSGIKSAHTGSGSLLSSGGSGSGQHRTSGTGYAAPANYVDPAPSYSGFETSTYGQDTGYEPAGYGTTGYEGTTAGTGTPLPPPPYGTVPPEGSVVPPNAATGWDDPARPGGVS